MKVIPNTNHVLVRQIGEPGRSGFGGLQVPEWVETHLLQSCVGIVEAVCDNLYYGGYELLELGFKPAGVDLESSRRINELSTYYDVDIEVKPGDMVIYRYTANEEEETLVGDGTRLIRYDDLIGRIDKQQPYVVMYPLNGSIFVEMNDTVHGHGHLAGPTSIDLEWGDVVAEGMLIRSYLQWSEKGGDEPVSLLGKRICFKPLHAIRIEPDAFRILDTGTQYPLYYLQRCDVNGYLKDES